VNYIETFARVGLSTILKQGSIVHVWWLVVVNPKLHHQPPDVNYFEAFAKVAFPCRLNSES